LSFITVDARDSGVPRAGQEILFQRRINETAARATISLVTSSTVMTPSMSPVLKSDNYAGGRRKSFETWLHTQDAKRAGERARHQIAEPLGWKKEKGGQP
jgi:hypothetical protein